MRGFDDALRLSIGRLRSCSPEARLQCYQQARAVIARRPDRRRLAAALEGAIRVVEQDYAELDRLSLATLSFEASLNLPAEL